MDINTYTQHAVKTEATVETLTVNLSQLKAILTALIAAGNLLDVLKKDTFYGLPTDANKLKTRNQRAQDNELALEGVLPGLGYNDSTEQTNIVEIQPRVFHAIVGVATEATELMEALLSAITTNQPLDTVNLLEEAADVCWYLAILHDALKSPWSDNLTRNIEKLRARYPNKFDKAATENRDLVKERQILATGV